jgi:hypothetical protein
MVGWTYEVSLHRRPTPKAELIGRYQDDEDMVLAHQQGYQVGRVSMGISFSH